MAHVVGVPRRDPCQKCKLPVFLAERLTVGKKVFHRTCLKCGRCGSQLAIGSFYETEVDDVYCCETCPDEEEFEESLNNVASGSKVELRGAHGTSNANSESQTPIKTMRSSIADRLAFFEQSKTNGASTNTHNVLEKSVSDEEKTKDLEATSAVSTTPSYKMNTALSSFLNDTIDGEAEEDEEESSEISSSAQLKVATAMHTSDTEDESESSNAISRHVDSLPPELPTTKPPTTEEYAESKRFTATAALQLAASTTIIDDHSKELTTSIPGDMLVDDDGTVKGNNDVENNYENEQKTVTTASEAASVNTSEAHKSINNDLDLSATLNVKNESVTKDTNADALDETTTSNEMKKTKIEEITPNVVELRVKNEQHNEDKATMERLSVVRARLQQFEEITYNKTNNNNNNINDDNEIKLNSTETTRKSPDKDNLMLINANDDKIKLNKEEINKKEDNDNVNDDVKQQMASASTVATTEIETTKIETPKSMPQENRNEEANEKIKVAAALIEEITTNAAANEASATTPPKASPRNVPSRMEIQNEMNDEINIKKKKENETKLKPTSTTTIVSPSSKLKSKTKIDEYPEDLNPFASDDDDDDDDAGNKENAQNNNKNNRNHSITKTTPHKLDNSNPFDSSDDEIELEKMNSTPSLRTNASGKLRPPRPPPPRISRNPFEGESDDNDADNFSRNSSLSSSAKRKTPVPTPRSNLSQSQNPTPEPTPRLSNRSAKSSPPHSLALNLNSSGDHYGSFNSLGATTPLHRNSDIRGSNNSLTSSAGGNVRSRKNRKVPAPPQPPTVKELFPSTETLDSSKASTPSSSTVGSPKSARKKRPAPAPPKPARNAMLTQITPEYNEPKNLHSYPLQSSTSSKLSDEEKALLEGKTDDEQTSVVVLRSEPPINSSLNSPNKLAAVTRRNSRRLIPLDATLLKDAAENAHEKPQCDDQKQQELSGKISELPEEDHNVVYRRVIMPPSLNTPTREENPLIDSLHTPDRQSEKLKDNKEAKNRNRQSQQSASSGAEDNDSAIYNKSAHGKWKRRKGPAPALPIPPRKVLQMLPLQEIRHELEIIEVQQQGLEKQGVVLEKMIRDRCEGQSGEQLNSVAATALTGAGDQGFKAAGAPHGVQNSKEVEDLILQLFELVNEKNELFRRQAELMYLRRQHRLEQEQADLEYEIRVLMAQPERNKTDTDKAREEALIARLVDVVQLRNEVVECLEMDRLREAEEDMSIKLRLEQHNAKRDGHASDDSSKKYSTKLSKKEKKKQKEAKKLSKNKKIDADKDADESELNADKQKLKKKKRKFLF